MVHKEAVQQYLMSFMISPDGVTMRNLYFRLAMYRGDKNASLNAMLEMMGMPGFYVNGLWVYKCGSKETVPEVDRFLMTEYELYKRWVFTLTDVEADMLRRYGLNANYISTVATSR